MVWCKFGQGDSLGLAEKIEKLYVDRKGFIPAKTKIGISGCKLNCAESYLKDIGMFATKDGWSFVVGGNSGGRPRIGDIIAENLSEDKMLELLEKVFVYYSRSAKPRERMPRFIQRIGIDEFKNSVL